VGAGGRAVAGRDTRAQTDDAIPITDSSPFDLPVEIYGILYIYNPVSMERLGVDKAAAAAPAQQPAQPTTEASKPTGAPAAAAEAPTPQ
jgi:hypothetical protein